MKYAIFVLLLAGIAWLTVLEIIDKDTFKDATILSGQENTSQNAVDSDASSVPTEQTSKKYSKADSIVNYAKLFLGTPYNYACASKEDGFDCSGFIWFVYKNFDINIPRSSSLQGNFGAPVSREGLQKGDLVIFTGTDPSIRKPGHIGIVIDPDSSLTFIHASSSRKHFGVVIGEVKGTGYEKRLLGFRRVY